MDFDMTEDDRTFTRMEHLTLAMAVDAMSSAASSRGWSRDISGATTERSFLQILLRGSAVVLPKDQGLSTGTPPFIHHENFGGLTVEASLRLRAFLDFPLRGSSFIKTHLYVPALVHAYMAAKEHDI